MTDENTTTLRLTLKPEERVDIDGQVTLIAHRSADLVFQGTAKIGRRYFLEAENDNRS